MKQSLYKSLYFLILLCGLAACEQVPNVVEPDNTPTAVSAAVAPTTTMPTAVAENSRPNDNLPPPVQYNLGDATIIQARFPEDSRFREMPVRLNGIIAVPETGEGPYPVVVVFHGTHPGCPVDEMSIDRWPCAPEDEQANYQGFDYLISNLAAQGYVALSINLNAENTFGFGEPQAGERLLQLVDLHLSALATAVSGGQNDFGVELNGRADMQQLALVGHSRGGEAAVWLAEGLGLAAPEAYEKFGFGPVRGVLLLAPAVVFVLPAAPSVPLAVILPACDGDVMRQDGQLYYEAARLNAEQSAWATSVWLDRANHNFFNSILRDDSMGRDGRPDCEPILDAETQQTFLVDYAADFFTAVFSEDIVEMNAAMTHLGMNVQAPAPDSLLGLPARISDLTAVANRLRLLVPTSAGELTTNLSGGTVTATGVSTHFCEEGYYTPMMKPGSEPCKRVNLTIPGDPFMLVISWEQRGGTLRFALPPEAADLSSYTTISLRTAVDPLSSLNPTDTHQAFSVQLTDSTGNVATAQTRPAEPALMFPIGYVTEDSFFEGGQFSGRVPMTTIRLPLSDFSGMNLTQISEVALLFDQTPSGSLFMGDIELVRP